MIFPRLLPSLLQTRPLSKRDSKAVFTDLFSGRLTKAQAKSLLLLLAKRGERPEEISGCLEALRSLEPHLKNPAGDLMDTCGTGGDGSHSLNVSTLSALVIAGAGGRVAKHGNRSISSSCGSSDLIEAFGVKIDAAPKLMMKALVEAGIGYFHAPFYHPVFSRMQSLRRELKVRTILNLLGPLANPFKLSYQILGVSKKEYLPIFAQVLKDQGLHSALVCHSQDGLDEISCASATWAYWIKGGKIIKDIIHPSALGFKRARISDYRGGSIQKNKELSLRMLQGRIRGPQRDIVILNAAAGLVVSEKAEDLKEGIALASQSIDGGAALAALESLKKISNS